MKGKHNIMSSLEAKSRAYHINFKVMKPIKLRMFEEAVGRHEGQAEEQDWLFPEEEEKRISASKFRLRSSFPEGLTEADIGVL